MASFQIEGGRKLSGELVPQGAKNEALQVLCAILLTDKEVIIDNIPDIVDVNNLITLITNLGVQVKRLSPSKWSFKAESVNLEYLLTDEYKQKSSSLRVSAHCLPDLVRDIFQNRVAT
jgi:UDP-N-acetylglucosamine 1-carboxyvinyltransferase